MEKDKTNTGAHYPSLLNLLSMKLQQNFLDWSTRECFCSFPSRQCTSSFLFSYDPEIELVWILSCLKSLSLVRFGFLGLQVVSQNENDLTGKRFHSTIDENEQTDAHFILFGRNHPTGKTLDKVYKHKRTPSSARMTYASVIIYFD